MTVEQVLKALAIGSTVSAGRVAGYAVKRDGKVVGYVEAQLKNWKMHWTAYWYADGAIISSKPSMDLAELMSDFGAIDLLPSYAPDHEEFFRLNPPSLAP